MHPFDPNTAVFQANPAYELISFADLPEDQREILAPGNEGDGYFGILRPHPGEPLGVKSISHDTARLFQALRAVAPLPPYVAEQTGPAFHRTVLSLILDSVLLVERSGRFVTGPAVLSRTSISPSPPRSALAKISLEALHYAEAHPVREPAALAARLYRYNTLPLTAAWRARLPDEAAVRRELGVSEGGRNDHALRSLWFPTGQNTGWLAWQRKETVAELLPSRSTFKLYVSPWPDCLPEAFDALVAEAASHPVQAFKAGFDAHGWLRPDKLVVYFASRDALESFASAIIRRLAGMRSHPVPFTASFDNSGLLLSWGSDPPDEPGLPAWLKRVSWRQWVTNALAVALAAAKNCPGLEIGAADYAIERIRLEGVDTTLWTRSQPDSDTLPR